MHLVFCIHHFGLPNESRVLYVLGRTFRWISKKCAAKIPSETKEVTHPWVSAPSIQERKVKRSFFGGENLYIYIYTPVFFASGKCWRKSYPIRERDSLWFIEKWLRLGGLGFNLMIILFNTNIHTYLGWRYSKQHVFPLYHQSFPPGAQLSLQSQAASQAMIANAHLRRAKAGSVGSSKIQANEINEVTEVMGFSRSCFWRSIRYGFLATWICSYEKEGKPCWYLGSQTCGVRNDEMF